SALWISDGRLAAREAEHSRTFDRWLRSLFAEDADRPQFLALERSDDLSLILRAQLFEAADPSGEGPRRLARGSVHAALAYRSLHDPSRLFGLTCAERVLTEYILSGASIASAQTALNVSSNTIRTHLKAIYRKTGAHNQADLVRLLREVAMPSPPAAAGSR